MRRIIPAVIIIALMGTGAVFALQHLPTMRFVPSGNPKDAPRPQRMYDVALSKDGDSLCAVKHLRELSVYRHGALLKIFRVALGDAPAGHKHFQGDEKTPEGLYYIESKNPASGYHKNLGISYPNAADRAYAAKAHKDPGGEVKIHGLPNGQGYIGKGHLSTDWTNGCIAVTDEEIDELYTHIKVGTPIMILP